jgi:hypothetical protein
MSKLVINRRKGLSQLKSLAKRIFEGLSDWSLFLGQKRRSLVKVPVDESRTLHILLMKRAQYIKPVIKCCNSIWDHAPETRIEIWIDDNLREDFQKEKHRLMREDRVDTKEVPLQNSEWQKNKLQIISNEMNPEDLFVDADLIWNGAPPRPQTPMFFVSEYLMNARTLTLWLLRKLKVDLSKNWYMLNVSVVGLSNLSKDISFQERVNELYDAIRHVEPDDNFGFDDIPTLRRMSEQIALSIAVQELGEYTVLKDSDTYMDGGIAESYYLGAISGFD